MPGSGSFAREANYPRGRTDMLSCPLCQTTQVRPSHRRGILERGPLTWVGVLPFRCGQCQTRFYTIALNDPRRQRSGDDTLSITDQVRAPRWRANVPAVITVYTPGQEAVVLNGVAMNASLEGACLRLSTVLAKGSLVGVAFEGGPSRLGSVRWVMPQQDSEALHGIRFQVSMERRGVHSRRYRRLRLRRVIRQVLIGVIGLIFIATAAFAVNWLVEGLRTYDPKYYEPKDLDRQAYEKERAKAAQK